MLNHKWMSMTEYQRETGLGRLAVQALIEKGQLIATTTDGGGKILIKVELKDDTIHKEVEMLRGQIDKLCRHLGVKV